MHFVNHRIGGTVCTTIRAVFGNPSVRGGTIILLDRTMGNKRK